MKKLLIGLLIVIIGLILFSKGMNMVEEDQIPAGNVTELTYQDIQKVDRYAKVIGRAVACGIDTIPIQNKLLTWIEGFEPSTMNIHMRSFNSGISHHARVQAIDLSTCSDVKATFIKTNFVP